MSNTRIDLARHGLWARILAAMHGIWSAISDWARREMAENERRNRESPEDSQW